MGPCIADMTAEKPLDPWVSSPVGEDKFMTEHGLEKELNSCNQDNMPTEECAAVTDSLCSEGPFCRICHEGRASGELLSPCKCSGSLAIVHHTCLEHWLTASNSTHCELCYHQFALEHLPNHFIDWLCSPLLQQQRRTLCGDILWFLVITLLVSLSASQCVIGARDFINSIGGLVLMVLMLGFFAIYIYWTMVCVCHHLHLFKTWKKTDQRVRLQIPLPPHTTHNQQKLSINTLGKGTNKETVV